jgi:hypothetical protein
VGWWVVSERTRTGRVVAQQSGQVVRATPLRVVSGQGQESQRLWVAARGD